MIRRGVAALLRGLRCGQWWSRRGLRSPSLWALAAWLLAPGVACAGERYAVIVTGASGGPEYAEKYQGWRAAFTRTLTESFGYPTDHIIALGEDLDGSAKSTRENVRSALASLRKRAADDDTSVVLLMGHGSADSEEAKFNLVGPDLTVDEWASLVRPVPGRVVFVNASSGSFPFLAAMAGRNRVVLTANDSAAQQFETVFPDFFIKAFAEDAADLDKSGKASVLEAFTYASAKVKSWFEERGRLATERALIDDTGAGVGRDVDTPGKDGEVARLTYLQPEVPVGMADNPELASLMRRRAQLEDSLTLLRTVKDSMPLERFEDELERILLELIRLDRQLRAKT